MAFGPLNAWVGTEQSFPLTPTKKSQKGTRMDFSEVKLTLCSLKRRTSLKSLASRNIRNILVDRSTALSSPAKSSAYVHA